MWNSVLVGINGDRTVESVEVADSVTGNVETVPIDGVFVAIGHEPNTSLFVEQLQLDDKGYLVLPASGTTATYIPGVFAAGDVADARYRQAVSAAGTGCMAALDAQHYLATHGE
jgi:thioredoxin reductase (NADPH)